MKNTNTMKIYLAGPMSGLPDYNYPAFHRMAALLRAKGYEVLNPAENPVPHCKGWQGYMRLAIAQLVQCDGIVLLDGWEKSKGARIEFGLALDLDLLFCDADSVLTADTFPVPSKSDLFAIKSAFKQALSSV